MRPCDLKDEKSQKLYEDLKPSKGKKAKNLSQQQLDYRASSFSQRLQTENPFEEFRQAVENAVIEKAKKPKKVFEPDMKFYREQDDQGITLSMHQPWASLLVQGFKRFEGRQWTNKYRGPLWIHATTKKPTQEEIDYVEGIYTKHYKKVVGENMPKFPERYLTGVLVGRVDLIDIISLQEYQDTIPKPLQEPTESDYQFIVRNPCILDIPLKMSGQPGVYKMPREVWMGAKAVVKQVPYTWWPPEEYKNFSIGRFDLYPDEFIQWDRNEIINHVEKNQVTCKPEFSKISEGCFHLKGFLSAAA